MRKPEMMTHAAGHQVLLLAIGNEDRAQDSIGPRLCDMVAQRLLGRICYINLGIFQNYAAQCISGHRSVVVVDAIVLDNSNRTSEADLYPASIIDLNPFMQATRTGDEVHQSPLTVQTAHGFTWLDELVLGALSNSSAQESDIALFGINSRATAGMQAAGAHPEIASTNFGPDIEALHESLYNLLISKIELPCTKQQWLPAS